tara:strand:- start:1046 stop:1228 length:183 start_codon:yes stop_codon:yes gene_type:complete
MTEEGKKFFGWFYAIGLAIIMCIHGCVEVGGGSSSGTASNEADTTSTSEQEQTQAYTDEE